MLISQVAVAVVAHVNTTAVAAVQVAVRGVTLIRDTLLCKAVQEGL